MPKTLESFDFRRSPPHSLPQDRLRYLRSCPKSSCGSWLKGITSSAPRPSS
jgi:hypothetical protein